MIKKILYILCGVIVFFIGVVLYGILLNTDSISLHKVMVQKNLVELKDPIIRVDKSHHKLSLYNDTTFIKSYKIVFGRSKLNFKSNKNDYVTPTGKYRICEIDTNSRYHIYFKLNYPNIRDAAEALKLGLITNEEYFKIEKSVSNNLCSFEKTILGSNIGIHGTGRYNLIFKNLPFVFNWTNGSIAVSNENIDELLSVIKIGTIVIIRD